MRFAPSGDAPARRRITCERYERFHRLSIRCHLDGMIVETGRDLRASSEHGLERLRSSAGIFDLHRNAVGFEMAELLCQRGRHVHQVSESADHDVNCGRLACAPAAASSGR